MNKVLIVDDEVLVRNYLQTLIDWEAHGFIICAEAVNGTEAIQMIDCYVPHIVIMDIHMPGMDGVSLSKYMYEHKPEIKKIVLSSHDKFDYVRETLKTGAIDYLLKHEMDDRALLRILNKARNELTKEAEQLKRWETISPSVTRNAIRDLILGQKDGLDQIQSVLNYHAFLNYQHIVVAALQIEDFSIITSQYNEAETNKLIGSAMELSRRIVNDLKIGIVSYMEQGRFVIVFFFEQFSQKTIQQQVETTLHRIRKSLQMYLNINLQFEYSTIIRGLSNIPESYRATSNLLNRYGFPPSHHKAHNELIEGQLVSLSLEHERKLMTAVNLLNEGNVQAIIEEVFFSLQKQHANHDSIQLVVNELIHIANKIWLKSGNKDKYYDEDYLSRDRMKRYDKLDDIMSWQKSLYGQLIRRLFDIGDGKYSIHVGLAVKQIRLHYHEDLSLEQVAETIGITTSYLSRLFKEEMDCGFTAYLNKVRIRVAKQLIESGDYKIKEIYGKVGFNSYNYFFRVFKETTGLTPYSYAKTIN